MVIEREADGEAIFLHGHLMESCEDDVELSIEVLQDFRETTPSRLSRLFAAVEADDPNLVRFEAHSLKGSARTIGAEALAVVGARLEEAGKRGDLSDAHVLLAETERRLHNLNYLLAAHLSDL